MRILLLKPYSSADEIIPPFGLGYLATAIRNNHDVKIIDSLKDQTTPKKLEKVLKKENFDLVGIQVFTFQVSIVKDYINIVKGVLPDARIVLGGPHPSCDAENIFNYFPKADLAFKGEAEKGLPMLLDGVDEHQIPGLIWKKGTDTIVNQPAFVEDLDALGFPAWDMLCPDTYPMAPHGAFFKNYPVAPMIITRGCPFSCTYCGGPLMSGKKIRSRSVDNVLEEVKLLYDKYGIREIHVEDDNFTFNRDFVVEFCSRLKAMNLDLAWACPNGVRLDTLDKELLETMKVSGLYSVSVGIESGSSRILKDMKKNLTKEKIKEKVDLIRSVGLEVIGFFILGYPTETKRDILKTIEFAKELDLKRAGFFVFKPFPGTAITNELIEKGELPKTGRDFSNYILAGTVYSPPGISKKELKNLRRRALLAFYLRPKIIFKFISEINSPRHLKVVLKRIYSWLFK